MNLLWIDLETTGLDPEKDKILEVAAVVTNQDLEEIEIYESVVKQVTADITGWPRIQHERSGLLEAIRAADKWSSGLQWVEAELVRLIVRHFDSEPILCNNTVNFDRRFLEKHMPTLHGMLHRNLLDVSAIRAWLAHRVEKPFQKQKPHRALPDLRESIAELKYYGRIL